MVEKIVWVFCFIIVCSIADEAQEVRHGCPGSDYILGRSGCRVWCRGRVPHPSGFGMKAIDYVIGDRRDGLPCIGARESDSASSSDSSSESSGSDSDESSNGTPPNLDTVLNEAGVKRDKHNESSSSDSSDASNHYEIVVDPLYLGVCRKGVCVPTLRR
ncbi:uncharacterized protein LOC100903930 [Galendromus occidentalis]|uniref:Uncharacterized protein LOC100903930 n=1 Tax=Galendromus occidentalis TaxID=34638 RepID=A0AAJ6VWR2_9ACAR|nr:uncharacterized protein LOC100903930 [Galendromus occidentalis]